MKQTADVSDAAVGQLDSRRNRVAPIRTVLDGDTMGTELRTETTAKYDGNAALEMVHTAEWSFRADLSGLIAQASTYEAAAKTKGDLVNAERHQRIRHALEGLARDRAGRDQ